MARKNNTVLVAEEKPVPQDNPPMPQEEPAPAEDAPTGEETQETPTTVAPKPTPTAVKSDMRGKTVGTWDNLHKLILSGEVVVKGLDFDKEEKQLEESKNSLLQTIAAAAQNNDFSTVAKLSIEIQKLSTASQDIRGAIIDKWIGQTVFQNWVETTTTTTTQNGARPTTNSGVPDMWKEHRRIAIYKQGASKSLKSYKEAHKIGGHTVYLVRNTLFNELEWGLIKASQFSLPLGVQILAREGEVKPGAGKWVYVGFLGEAASPNDALTKMRVRTGYTDAGNVGIHGSSWDTGSSSSPKLTWASDEELKAEILASFKK